MLNISKNKYLKDIHKDARCFIACTGPSLNDIPVDQIYDSVIIGLNRAYLKQDLNIQYLCVADALIAEQFGHEISKQNIVKITSASIHKKGFINSDYIWRGNGGNPIFQSDITKPIYGGGTVTYIALQIAYYMGFAEVYLIGCDHYFDNSKADKIGDKLFVGTENDINHFDPSYYNKGTKWFKQDTRKVEKSYLMARKSFEKAGRILLNASTRTALSEDIIPRIDFKELW